MSINGAMLSGVSGLLANATMLASISDNIANVNTVGYKRNQTDFQTIVTGGNHGRSHYNAGGVLATSTQKVTGQGALQRTANATDLGIDGQGFFVATGKADGLTAGDARMFTRAGSFTLDRAGNLQNSAGLYLQGWPVNADGTVDADPSDLTRLRTINITQVGGAVEPTTRAAVSANLRASQPLSAEAAAYDAATNSMAAYDPVTGAGVRPDFELQVPVTDSLGGRRTLTVSFLRRADPATPGQAVPNQWHAEIRAVPADEIEGGAGLANGQIRTGIVAFTADGVLDTAATTLFGTPYSETLSIGGSGSGAPGAGAVKWADGLGIEAQALTLDLAEAGGLTQYDSASVVRSVATDGATAGSLAGIEIDGEGFVTAIFDNGVTRRVAQVALATVPNPDGLKALSGNAWLVSNSSGAFSLKTPGEGGAGRLSAASLEASTVDLSSEFTGLITTQRAYSASSKIITTADEMLEELIRIKR